MVIENFNWKSTVLIIIVLMQTLLVLIAGTLDWVSVERYSGMNAANLHKIILWLAACLAVVVVYLIGEIARLARRDREAEVNEVRLNESKQMIDVLRTHRHDFMNHIQIIYTLAQMGKTECLAKYVGNLKGNVEAEAKLSKLAQPELAAFIIKKISSATDADVKLGVDFETSLAETKMPLNDMVSILGNLLDNAIYATGLRQSGEKRVQLKLAEDEQRYIISVCNNGPEIPAELRESIFEKGFTTKGKGSGYGLHIVRTIVEQHGGTIRLTEAEGFSTCFEVILPKKTH
jgi:sensor histidine kinase regulating citrate/malate metabolism